MATIQKGGMMSIWAENTDWFDEWIFEQAIEGRFGNDIQSKAKCMEAFCLRGE